jgi:hypothetical protein
MGNGICARLTNLSPTEGRDSIDRPRSRIKLRSDRQGITSQPLPYCTAHFYLIGVVPLSLRRVQGVSNVQQNSTRHLFDRLQSDNRILTQNRRPSPIPIQSMKSSQTAAAAFHVECLEGKRCALPNRPLLCGQPLDEARSEAREKPAETDGKLLIQRFGSNQMPSAQQRTKRVMIVAGKSQSRFDTSSGMPDFEPCIPQWVENGSDRVSWRLPLVQK